MTETTIEDHETIPEELQERDQWLFWNASSDKPRKPLSSPDANYGASWSDPDEWVAFDEAIAKAEAVPKAGIGYVNAANNDDYARGLYAVIDLDGVVDPDGSGAKDWVPSLQPFFDRDAYIEFSPSGDGLHIPVVGIDVPDWWADAHFTDDEHEGIEVLANKFSTFTGDQLPKSGEEVVEYGEWLDEWLRECYRVLHDEDPLLDADGDQRHSESTETAEYEGDEWFTEDVAEEALEAIPNTVSYPVWRDIGMALSNFFGRATGERLFKRWSRGCSKWDSNAEVQAERIVNDASSWNYDAGTIIHFAKQHGWEPPILSHTGESGPTSTADIDGSEVERGEEILEMQTAPDDPVGQQFVYENGGYGISWAYRNDDGEITDSGVDQVCNFTLETLSYLSIEDKQHDEFVVRVRPSHPTEQPYDVRITPAVFNNTDTFRSEVVTGRTTWFDPSNREKVRSTTILRYLRETVGAQPAPHRTGLPYIGLSEDGSEFVTPVGSLTDGGWSDDPEFEYYSIGGDNSDMGPFSQKWALDPDDGLDVDEDTVARICELLPNTRQIDRGLPIYGWFYAAPLKTHIHSWTKEFPILAPHADTGTGKTSTLETFMKAFGGSGEPVSSTDTPFTKEKHLAESRGFPVWVDEYKPTEMPAKLTDHLHQRLKEVTKERIMPKGRPDLGINQLHMRAPVILSGEQKINDAAVRRRSLLTNLAREPTRDGTEERKAFGELTGIAYESEDGTQQYPDGYDLHHHARAYYQWVLEKDVSQLRRRWNEARDRMTTILERLGVTLEASEQRALQTMIFGVQLARDFAAAFDADLGHLPDDDDVRAASEHVISNIGKDGQRREHADEFLEVLSLAATEEYLEHGVHHRVLESRSTDTEVLAIHMPSTFSQVRRYVRDSNLEEEYTLLSKTDYTNSFGNKADTPQSYVIETNKRTKKIDNGGRAIHFDHEKIREKLGADFNIDAFRPESEQSDDSEPATPIAELSADGNPYTTVTVEVANWDVGPDGGPAESGVFKDESGIVDAVDFMGTSEAGKLEEDGYYRIENARVSTYEGTLQLEIVQNTTEITEIQSGVGHTSSPGPGSGDDTADGSQSSLEAASDGGHVEDSQDEDVETDAEDEDGDGVVQLHPKVKKAVLDRERDHDGGVPHDVLLDAIDEPSGDVEHSIDHLLTNGEIHEPKSDHYRTT